MEPKTGLKGVAYIFPGQGAQYVGMGEALLEVEQEIRDAFEQARKATGRDFLKISLRGPEEILNDTVNAQPSLFILSLGIFRVLERKKLWPQYLAGHSLGEYAALCAAGVFDFLTGLHLVVKRGEVMAKAAQKRPGGMIAVLGARLADIEQVLTKLDREVVAIANYNCPGQIVVSAESRNFKQVQECLSAIKPKKLVVLPVSGAFHSPAMSEAADIFQRFLQKVNMKDARIPVVQNTVALANTKVEEIKAALSVQIKAPVRWQESIEYMLERGVKTFVEVGPGTILGKMVKRISKEAEVFYTETPDKLRETISELVVRRGLEEKVIDSAGE
jgi:[acyl-carrier-protein] S-malonyltransferase